MEQKFLEDMFLVITKPTFELLLQEKDFTNLYALYSFYYYTAKWQGTNQPRCTTGYTAKGLGWNERKVMKHKKRLVELGLIEDVQTRGEHNKITGHYIKVIYILKKTTELKIQENEEKKVQQTAVSCEKSHPVKKPHCGSNHTVANWGDKCLKSNNLNALSVSNSNALRVDSEKPKNECKKAPSKEDANKKQEDIMCRDDDSKKTKEKQVRHKYGEYQNVLLSDTEYEKLVNEFPDDYQERIERLSEYIASTGKRYKDFLATIRSWARRENKEIIKKRRTEPRQQSSNIFLQIGKEEGIF